MGRGLFNALGLVALGAGLVGVFLPVLPTTPFLLTAAYCFSKGSPRFRARLEKTKIYGRYVAPVLKNPAMTLKAKLSILLPATAILAAAFVLSPWWPVRALLVFVCLAKYLYFFTRIATIDTRKHGA